MSNSLYDHDMESLVLQSALDVDQPHLISKIRERIPHPLYFHDMKNRVIWQSILEMDDNDINFYDKNQVVHFLSTYSVKAIKLALDIQMSCALTRDLGIPKKGDYKAHGRFGHHELHECENSVMDYIGEDYFEGLFVAHPASHLEAWLKTVEELYARRISVYLIEQTGKEIQSLKSTKTVDSVLSNLGKNLLSIGSRNSTETETMEDIRHGLDFNIQGSSSVKVGYPVLDDNTVGFMNGFRCGGLYVIAARPGAGKTSFAINVASHIGSQEHAGKVLFITLEVKSRDLFLKMIAAHDKTGEFSFMDLENPNKLMEIPGGISRIEKLADDVSKFNIKLFDKTNYPIDRLRQLVARLCNEEALGGSKISMVIVDYLQLLSGTNESMNDVERISEISRMLKIMAQENDIPVIALSQLNRDSEKGATRRAPKLVDLRGSGSIEQDADGVIFLYWENDPTSQVEMGDPKNAEKSLEASAERNIRLIVAKNRFGSVGDCDFLFDAKTGAFYQSNPSKTPSIQEIRSKKRRKAESAVPHESEDVF